MTIIFSLPLCLFDVIKDYLICLTLDNLLDFREHCQNWRNFCNSSPRFYEIKKLHIFYNLNVYLSLAYLCYKDENMWTDGVNLHVKESVSRILPFISNSHVQIKLTMDEMDKSSSRDPLASVFFSESLLDKYQHQLSTVSLMNWVDSTTFCNHSSLQHMKYLDFYDVYNESSIDLSKYSNLKYLSLRHFCDSVVFTSSAASVLRNCIELDLSFTDIEDVSLLGNVKKLILQSCKNLSDISALKNANYLDFTDCKKINDVSMLENVKTLILNRCSDISDISMLGDVLRLNICGLSRSCLGLPHQNNVKCLTISPYMLHEVEQFHFPDNVRRLVVCGNCPDLSCLQSLKYRYIRIEQNTLFVTVYNMMFVQKLSFSSGINLRHLKNLPCLSYLSYAGRNFSSIQIDYLSLPSLTSLELLESDRSESIEINFPLKYVIVKNCEFLMFSLKTDISSFRIYRCFGLSCDKRDYKIEDIFVDHTSSEINFDVVSTWRNSNNNSCILL
jgi:hypothetical protein